VVEVLMRWAALAPEAMRVGAGVEVKDVWKLGSIGMMTQGGGGKPRLKTVKPRLKMVSGSRVIVAP
jgi:hypothetical protein